MSENRDLVIDQGRSFKYAVRWEVLPIVYKAITGVVLTPQPVVTAPDHGLPDGWRVALTGIKGATQLNAQANPPKARDYLTATLRTLDTFELNQINAAGGGLYTTGGFIQYYTPKNLTGFTARMQVRDKFGGTVLQSLTSSDGHIVVDSVNYVIMISLQPTDTATSTWTTGVYDLELISPSGEATTLLYGAITLNPQVTL